MSNAYGKGQKLYKEAKKIIPGGTQLLSKRPEMFLPDLWPSYYSKAKGVEIWDLDGNKYFDFASMGVGSCTLGYADEYVNSKVKEAIDNSSMSSLNSPEEVFLAKKLIDLHPWSEMVRFAKTGGEACAIACRIARAHTGKDKIAFCGYHGWHDWYIAANLNDNTNLNNQLLKGLDSSGVPSYLSGTAIPFLYNNVEMFERVIGDNKEQVAAIYMEPIREQKPQEGFLETIKKIAKENNIVLIFDEITSGFRKNIGGIHLDLGIEPDIAVFGKALGNGYPISAIVGNKKVMNDAQKSFISSTFFTERVGFSAAIATIEKYEELNVPLRLIEVGKKINDAWLSASSESKLKIKITGIEPLTHIEFDYDESACMQTIYTQEMLKRGYLVGSNLYASYAYSDEVLKNFSEDTFSIFKTIKMAFDNKKLTDLLDGPIKHSGFKRLT